MAPGGQGDDGYGTSAAPLQHRLRDRAASIPTASVFLEPSLNRETTPTCTATCTRPRHRRPQDFTAPKPPSSFVTTTMTSARRPSLTTNL